MLSLSGGGAQREMMTLAHAFAARGHKVDLVVVRSQDPPRQEISPLVRLVALDPWWTHLPRVTKGPWALASIPALARYLQRERPAVLLSCCHLVNVAAPWARALAGVRTKLVIRVGQHLSRGAVNIQRRFELWQARLFYPRADAIITNSYGVANDVLSVTGLPPERIAMIYCPVVTPELQEKMRAPLDHPWFVPGGPPVLLAVGRLVAQKDFQTLLKAFARVRAVRQARLVILGEGKRRARLEVLAQKLGVAADVDLPGFALNPFPYMVRASVFVLSSAWEGFGMVVAEAMACGCSVVSTDCPSGPAEILDGGTYGPLVPVGDDAALANAILSVLETPPDPNRLRARAALFSVDHAADCCLELLLGLCKGEQPKNIISHEKRR
ncbi:MAG: glycosyltransferase [candidate division NC10 bacterium]|nr:glycosyltransferase [candidate division NC10 bacterium]MDE2322412.1 glycosyltransferase [candidate division NC10 bacterium]